MKRETVLADKGVTVTAPSDWRLLLPTKLAVLADISQGYLLQFLKG